MDDDANRFWDQNTAVFPAIRSSRIEQVLVGTLGGWNTALAKPVARIIRWR
jgi:hypothetical protein